VTSTADRLRELDRADFDTFGEPDAGPGEQPLATPEEVEGIRDAVFEAPWEDPARFPECMKIAVEALGLISVQSEPYAAQVATQALRSMVRRVKFGGPLDEDVRHG
jgi:hypothetical protein